MGATPHEFESRILRQLIDAEVFNDKLRESEDYYNYHRPHSGLGGQTPYERLKQKTTTQA
ncbi:integrase core domain-containing protein [Streptomyces chiangmaiensis]|uniref:Integrase core domain-containing protein n=1 Tax=Streptomyces chiangmaiensis TaxID=766497 RepID=A0ABU7FVH0_9ACTN|nr:integrase core domain-containing protein [Streptomyces chiangmaiensis]MED7828107.1 integrase core domain-containing protein [Streptomyces chiangmaiensis]